MVIQNGDEDNSGNSDEIREQRSAAENGIVNLRSVSAFV